MPRMEYSGLCMPCQCPGLSRWNKVKFLQPPPKLGCQPSKRCWVIWFISLVFRKKTLKPKEAMGHVGKRPPRSQLSVVSPTSLPFPRVSVLLRKCPLSPMATSSPRWYDKAKNKGRPSLGVFAPLQPGGLAGSQPQNTTTDLVRQ